MSLKGKVCLIKFVLSAMLLFMLSTFKMLNGVRERIIRI